MDEFLNKNKVGLPEIQQWVEDKMPDIVKDLTHICRIRSVAETEAVQCPPYGKGCLEVLEEMLHMGEENGFSTRNYDNYVGKISYDTSEQKESIGIWAHLDVVDEGEGWDYEPYVPVVKDGYFIARGCQDNKSSAIMGLYVLKYMKEHHIRLEHGLELYLGTCEEQGMFDLDYYCDNYECPALSLVPDSGFPVCCGERGSFNAELISRKKCGKELLEAHCDCGLYTIPDMAQVTLTYSKELWEKASCLPLPLEAERAGETIQIRARGISAHASNPEAGENALTILAEALCSQTLISDENKELFRIIPAINLDSTGKALDVFCEDTLSGPISLTATQLRMQDGHLVIGFLSKYPITCSDFPFEERAGAAAKRQGFDLKTTRLAKANYFNPEHAVAQTLTRTCREILKNEEEPFVMSGGTYARKLPNAFAFGTGMKLPSPPAGLFRPGHGDYHQPDESISLLRIRKALEIYICGILRIDKLDVKP